MSLNSRKLAGAALAFMTPFVLCFNYVFGHFYRHGSFLLDAGWFAYLLEGNPALINPAALGGGTYYSTHVSPFLSAFSTLGLIADPAPGIWLALLLGLCYGGLSLGVFAMSSASSARPSQGEIALSLAAAGLILWSGPVAAAIGYPHFEPLTCTFLLFFFYFLLGGRLRICMAFLVLGLSVREDSGFHVFALLVLLLLARSRGIAFTQLPGRFLAACAFFSLVWSTAALGIQQALFPGDDAFQRIYSGIPAFAHVTPEFVEARLRTFGAEGRWLYLPFLALAAWSLVKRRPAYLIGHLAFVPWFLLHLAALSDSAGTFQVHYAFPFIISLFWPLIAYADEHRRDTAPAAPARALALYALFLCLAAVRLPLLRMADPTLPDMEAFAELRRTFHEDGELLGPIRVDDSARCLVLDAPVGMDRLQAGERFSSGTAFLFERRFERAVGEDSLRPSREFRLYRLRGTPVLIASDRGLPPRLERLLDRRQWPSASEIRPGGRE